MASQPNVVLVMSDQHRADLLGCAGVPAVRTPTIDWLASDGVRFTRTNCQGPLCMPARASFLTERYVRDHGVYTNWSELEPHWPTYLWCLREAGYHTALVGKAHLYREGAGDVAENRGRLEALGFGEVDETGDKFATSGTPYTSELASRGLLETYRQHLAARSYQGNNESGQGATKTLPMWDSTPLPIPLDAYCDVWHGERAAAWVDRYERDTPFFLFVGFPGPHDPWDAPTEARELYASVDVPMPASTRRPDLEDTGRYGRMLRAFLDLSDTETMSDAAIAAMRVAYCSDVSVIDAAVGRIVAALERRGILDDTWVIYTSDHGEMAGDHGLMSKCVLYRQAVRVPLVIRPPGGCPSAVVDDLVEHVDVPATVRAIAGAAPIEGGEGRSLLGHLGIGSLGAPRGVSVSENWGFAAFETPRFRLVVEEDRGAPCQLFDVDRDGTEDVNVVADPNYRDELQELMHDVVRPFLATAPARPHRSPFTG